MTAPARTLAPRHPSRAHHGGLALLATAACTCNSLAGQGAQMEQYGDELVSLRRLDLPKGLPAVELTQVHPSRLIAEPDLQPPRLVCTVDIEGSTSAAGHLGRRVQLSDVGVERIPMKPARAGMTPVASPLPGLAGVLAALQARDAAGGDGAKLRALTTADCPERPRLVDAYDGGADDPPARWLIRTDVDGAAVTEERQSGHRLASVLRREDDRYLFASGVVPE